MITNSAASQNNNIASKPAIISYNNITAFKPLLIDGLKCILKHMIVIINFNILPKNTVISNFNFLMGMYRAIIIKKYVISYKYACIFCCINFKISSKIQIASNMNILSE